MTFGIQIINDYGRIQIDSDFSCPRMIMQGSAAFNGSKYGVDVAMPTGTNSECPIILARPTQVDKYIGGIEFYPQENNLSILRLSMSGECPFDWAAFSTTGSAISDGSTYGLEVYRANGSVAFSSRNRHPCLTHIFGKAPSYDTGGASGGWPNVYSFAGYSDMPWIFMNPLLQTGAGVGEFSESMAGIFAKVAAGFNSITVNMLDVAAPGATYPQFPALADRHAYNPYHQMPGYFAVATNY